MKLVLQTSSALLAGLLVAGVATAGERPYDAWQSKSDDDTSVIIEDSFNKTKEIHKTVDTDINLRRIHKEQNDYSSKVDYKTSEDNDWSSAIDYTHSEDNDTTTDVDFQIATPTMTSKKHQNQDAGHEAYNDVRGSADGHETAAYGGVATATGGNERTDYNGPTQINQNNNFLPQISYEVQGDSNGDKNFITTMAGRDIGDKGVFGTVGETSALSLGNVGNQSGASVDQQGDASNSATDSMSSKIRR